MRIGGELAPLSIHPAQVIAGSWTIKLGRYEGLPTAKAAPGEQDASVAKRGDNTIGVAGASRSVRPTASGCISDFRLPQTSSSWTGLVAITCQKRGTKLMFFVRLMSAKISATLPVASCSCTGRTVAVRVSG